jgi:FtsH-binding integral membrane protein
MLESNDTSRPQPVTLDYSTPRRPRKPSGSSYIALVLGLVAIGFFLLLVGSVWGRFQVGSRPLLFYLWIGCASAGFVAGVRGAADVNNYGGVGRGMSWVGVGVGGLTFLLLMVAPLGGVNVALLSAIIFLALVVLKK